MSEMIQLGQIVLNAGTQMRRWTSDTAVADYAELMKEGQTFDPIELYQVEDGRLVLVNGFHRVAAAKKAGLEQINATIVIGTMQEALWAAVAANKANAVRRTPEDIRQAIEAAMLHPNGALMSDRQIADYVGCTHPTVGSVRAKLVATGKITSDTVRVGKDGRKQDTEKIGLKHKMEHWQSLIYKPWEKECKGDLRLIKQGTQYLHICSSGYKGEGTVFGQYHLEYQYFSVRGGGNGYGAIVDDSYVQLFEAHGLKVEIVEFKDLEKPMQSIAKSAFSSTGYYQIKTRCFIPVPDDLQPGAIAAKRNTFQTKNAFLIGRVVGRADSFIHVRCTGEKSDQIWFGDELVSVDEARSLPSGLHVLEIPQIRGDFAQWIDAYWAYREMYAPGGIFVAKHFSVAAVALDEDARRLASVPGAISCTDPVVGDVTVILNVDGLKSLDMPIVALPIQDKEFDQAWRTWAANGRAAAAPVLNDASRAERLDGARQRITDLLEEASTPQDTPVTAAGITHVLFHALMDFKARVLDEINEDHELAEAYIPAVQLLTICAESLGFELDDDFEVV